MAPRKTSPATNSQLIAAANVILPILDFDDEQFTEYLAVPAQRIAFREAMRLLEANPRKVRKLFLKNISSPQSAAYVVWTFLSDADAKIGDNSLLFALTGSGGCGTVTYGDLAEEVLADFERRGLLASVEAILAQDVRALLAAEPQTVADWTEGSHDAVA